MRTIGLVSLLLTLLFNLPFVLVIIRHRSHIPLDWPRWVYQIRRWWRRGGKRTALHCLILLIGLLALFQLIWRLDAHGFNNH